MSKAIDLTGQRFGRLTVVERAGTTKGRQSLWKCKCDCGNEVTVLAYTLKSGRTTSCGCFQKETALKSIKKRNQFLRKDGTIICLLTAKKSKNNTSGVKGVFWDKKNQKWRAIIGFQGKRIYLGLFSTLEAAAKARAVAEEQYFQPILDKYKDENSTHLKCDLFKDTSNNSESTHFKCDLLEAQE